MVNWQIASFSVSTSAAGETSDALYANGRMQVLVNIQIKAIVPDSDSSSTPYTLSKHELDSIRLMDYFTHAELANHGNGWVWSTKKSPFAGSLYSTGMAEFQAEADSQLVQLWVSSTISEKKSIGASIRQPDNTVVRTSDSSYNSYIVLKAEPAIDYTYPENVGFEQEKAGSGHYKIDFVGISDPSRRWDQVNYYLTTKNHHLLYSETNSYEVYKHHNPYSDEHLECCYAGQVRTDVDGSLSLFFLWKNPLGTKASKPRVGLKSVVNGLLASGPWTAEAFADITVNDKKNSVCLSYLNFRDTPMQVINRLWPVTWGTVAKITVYDVHGNKGTFKASHTDENDGVVIHNDN
ncbi:uncharacterized protein TrAtP1_000203 [Trichoderma atroviride]|uniref:uncharacterized protein n=1 Tax=Hypocrea atroviridis TaxID=63577 RepID=UPI003325D4D5|nr:hypothetical protein TrAtP1_000203 [Trichoderma atroviride]